MAGYCRGLIVYVQSYCGRTTIRAIERVSRPTTRDWPAVDLQLELVDVIIGEHN